MTTTTDNLPDPNDPTTWPDSRLAAGLESLRVVTPALAEYMRRAEFRVERQKNLMRLAVELLRQPHVAVIDLEATCYDNPADNAAHANEVIEVGWALLDIRTLSVVDRRQFYVRPTTSFVSGYCTELTGIRPEQVAQAPSFAETMGALGELHALHARGPVTIWGSFGEYDRRQLERQCAAEGVAYPLGNNRHFNVKEAAGAFFGFGKKSPGLARSVARAGLQFEGQHHSGVDDAVNAARVLAHVLSATAEDSAVK
jgi:inhibitor of KinA sporulation pathway (predicted exonuclease)